MKHRKLHCAAGPLTFDPPDSMYDRMLTRGMMMPMNSVTASIARTVAFKEQNNVTHRLRTQ